MQDWRFHTYDRGVQPMPRKKRPIETQQARAILYGIGTFIESQHVEPYSGS